MAELVIGVDIGSTAIKTVVLDGENGQAVALTRAEYPHVSPRPGELEIEPVALVEAVLNTIREIPADLKADVIGLSLAGQMCGVVTLDVDRQPVGRCISIFDTRAVQETDFLNEHYGRHLGRREANHCLSIFPLPKVLWLRAREPERWRRTGLVTMPKDYIRGAMTGVWVTEPSDASGTLAYDQFASQWDDALLSDLNLPLSLWPEVIPSAGQAGSLKPDIAQRIGLTAGLPIFAGAADMAALPVGIGATTPEDLVVSFGTAAHVIAPVAGLTEDVWPIQQYTQTTPDSWYWFGAVFSGGASVDWFLATIGSDSEYERFDCIRWDAPDRQVLFMPYLAGAGAPHYVPEAGGAFVGLRTGHTSADLGQAVLEGVVMEVAEVCRTLDPGGTRRVHVTGGASRIEPLVQILANVLNREVVLAASPEATAVGAALLARQGATGRTPASVPPGTRLRFPTEFGSAYYQALMPRYQTAAARIRGVR